MGKTAAELEGMPPAELRILVATAMIDNLGSELQRHATLAAEIYNLGLRTLAAAGVEIPAAEYRNPDDYIGKFAWEQPAPIVPGEIDLDLGALL